MKEIDYSGYEKVIILIDKGLSCKEIKNHEDSKEFLSYHKQAKMLLIKHIIENKFDKDRIINIFYENTHK